VTLTLTANANGTCPAATDTRTIVVDQAATINAGLDQTICTVLLGTTTATMSANLGGAASSATWTTSGSGTFNNNNTNAIYTASAADIIAGSVTLTYTSNDPLGPCGPVSDSMLLIIKEAIEITTQPVNVGVCVTEYAEFYVGAIGDDLSYQWYKVGSPDLALSNTANISGVNTNTLSFNQAQLADGGSYYVVVSGNNACSSITSQVRSLNVNQVINITDQPDSATLCEGSYVEFSVAATGSIASYQWRKNGLPLNSTNTPNGSGFNSATLNLSNILLTNAGNYDVVISSPGGTCTEAYSVSATLTINPLATVDAGSDQTICSSTTATMAASIGGGASSGTWTTSGSGTFNNNSTAAVYTPSVADISAGSVVLTYTTNDPVGPCPAESDTITLTIYPEATVNAGVDQTICSTDTATMVASFGGGAGSATWTTSGSGTFNNNSLSAVYTPSVSDISAGSVILTYTTDDPNGPCPAASDTMTLTINPLPTITGETDVCIGSTINLSPSTGGTWISNNPSIATIDNTGLVTGVSAGSVTFMFTETATGCQNTSNSITVNALPMISGEGSLCVNQTLNLSPSLGGTWVSNNPSIATIDNNGLVTGVSAGSVSFTFTHTATGCQQTSGLVTVDPLPVISGETDICIGESLNLLPSTGGTWTSSNTSVAIINNSGLVTSVSTGNVTFTFTDYGTGCEATSTSITVNALPILAGPDEVCVGSTITLTPTTGGTWTSNNPTIATINNNGLVTGVSSGNVTFTFTDTVTGCSQTSNTVTVSPLPQGGILSFGDPFGRVFLICENPTSGYAMDLTLSGQVGTIVKWQYRTASALSWTTIPDGSGDFTGTVLTASQIESLNITESIVIRVEISSGSCAPNSYSSTAIISVIPSDIAPSPVQVSDDVICIGDSVILSSETGYGVEFGKFDGGAFDNSSITNFGWRITDEFGNTGYNFSSDADNLRPEKWLRTNPHDFDTANLSAPYTIYQTLWQSNSDPAGNKGFAIVSGDHPSTLETPVFSLSGLDEAVLTFDQAYNLTPGASIMVELSTDGGATYNTVLFQIDGPASSGNYDHFGSGTPGINEMEIDLGDYLGYPNLRIRFNYTGTRVGDIWAVDNIKVPEGPRGVTLEWWDTTDPITPIFIGNSNTETWTPTQIGWNEFEVTTALILDSAGNTCTDAIHNSQTVKVFAYDQYNVVVTATNSGICGTTEAQLSATVNAAEQGLINAYPTLDGYTGQWDIQGPAGYTISKTDPSSPLAPINNPNIDFSATDLGSYTFNWILVPTAVDENSQIMSNVECPPDYTAANIEIQNCSTLDFDGEDDHVIFQNHYNLSGSFSFEIWIKPDPNTETGGTNDPIQTILSKRDATSLPSGNGYDLRLTNTTLSFNYNGGSIVASNSITTNRWYHVAVTYDGSNYILYVDGIQVGTGGGTTPSSNSYAFILGAMDQNPSGGNPNPVNYYSGWMQELRIWDVSLTKEQIRQMMNQHIHDNGLVQGDVVPVDVSGLNWSSLRAYYQMLQPGAINSGYLLPTGGTNAFDGKLVNIETVQQETAPLPYISDDDGNWEDVNTTNNDAASPWLWGHSVWDYPNAIGIDGSTRIDWNIVEITNNNIITTNNRNITVLGLLTDAGTELIVTDPTYTTNPNAGYNENNPGIGLWVTHYLKLDGFMNLIGESQLVQKRYGVSFDDGLPSTDPDFTTNQVNESILDVSSAGYLKRDQQGTNNLFNYNYWSSPVSPINTTANNLPFNLGSNLRDGTNSITPQNITWNNTYNATGAVPLNLSRRWIYTYANKPQNTYSEWVFQGQTGSIATGLGYTMKGSGVNYVVNTIGFQNYSFMGKPHNNTISNTVSSYYGILVGNPYPCALDANAFINENGPGGTGSLADGTLYFWDHYQSSSTHILANYEGGYAQYNLSGGNLAVTPPITFDGYVIEGGTGTKKPGRYVPVAQGFFVTGSSVGGQVTFNNSQRAFQRETNDNSYNGSQFFRSNDGSSSKEKTNNNTVSDGIKRLRIEFKTPEGAIRPLLLSFVPNGAATDGVDYGYDAPNYDGFPCDLSWSINNQRYVIQGVGDFDKSKQYPLNLFMSNTGSIEISLKELENFDTPVNVFVYDALLGTYTKINNNNFKMSLDADNYSNRFFIAFQPHETLSIEDQESQSVVVNYLSSSNEIYVKTIYNIDIRQIYLINMIGQTVKSWNVTNLPMSNDEIRIPVSNVSTGNYILKVETMAGTINKKVIIN